MIARIKGVITSRGKDWVIIDVHDVGYLVHCSCRTLSQLPMQGTTVVLYVETTVYTDSITLYGFYESAEQDWFRLLTTVQGVGARVALQLLSALTPEQLAQAIATQNKTLFTGVPGIGQRLASRLLVELYDKVISLDHRDDIKMNAENHIPKVSGDAISALTNLGYGRVEAHSMVERAEHVLRNNMSNVSHDLNILLKIALQKCAVRKEE